MTEKKVIITVNEGKIRGIQKKSNFSGVEYYSFFGIPYGQSTSGSARFKDPVKVKPWKNILDASNENKEGCVQYSVRLERYCGSEDCLYNNIHTPNVPIQGDPLKPVIVCIHPGGGFHGSPETWCYGSPDYVMHRDIVYVCIAYRLHLLGFLNLGLEECSGNQGLKDIILSLRWIKENITAFSGDPDNVTLLGSSSGAFIVHLLMLSPVAKGLFHKAVIMGMYAFNPTLSIKNEHKEEAYKLAVNNFDYRKNEKNEKRLLSYLKKGSLQTVVHFRPELMCTEQMALLFPSSPFESTVDEGENAVIPESPEKLIQSTARIPIIFGMCDKEAAMGFIRLYKKGTMAKFYESYRQNCHGWGRNITDDEVKLIKKQIDAFYLEGGSIDNAPLSVKIDIQTDIAFSNVYTTLIDVIAADLPSSVFIYKFEYNDDNVNTVKNKIVQLIDEPLKGNCHAADFTYWNNTKDHWGVRTPSMSSKSREVVETFTKLISTFARTGNPNYDGSTVEWKPSTLEKPCYLNINETLSMVSGKLNGDRMEFWEGIQKQFNKKE